MTNPVNAFPPGNSTHRTFLNDQNNKEADSKVEADNGWLAWGLQYIPNPNNENFQTNKAIINGFGGDTAHDQIMSIVMPLVKKKLTPQVFTAVESNIDAFVTSIIANVTKACYKQKTRECVSIRDPIVLLLDLAEFVFDIVEKHSSGKGKELHQLPLRDQFANIEKLNIKDSEKEAQMCKLLEPCMEELYKTLLPNGIDSIGWKTSWALAPWIKLLKYAFFSPKPLVALFRNFFGATSVSNYETSKKQFSGSADGECLLDFINRGIPTAVQKGFPQLIAAISKFDARGFLENHPLKDKLIPLLNFAAECSAITLFSRLSKNDQENPLTSSLATLAPVFGNFFHTRGHVLRKHYTAHFEVIEEKKLILKQFGVPDANSLKNKQLRLEDLKTATEYLQNEKKVNMRSLAHDLWDVADLGNLPVFSSLKYSKDNSDQINAENAAKIIQLKDETIPSILVGALDGLFETEPGLIQWFAPEHVNTTLRALLAKIPTGTACEPWATVAADSGVDPLFNLLANPVVDIPKLLLGEIDKAVVVSDKSKNHLRTIMESILTAVAGHKYATPITPNSSGCTVVATRAHALKEFAFGNIQSIALIALNTVGERGAKQLAKLLSKKDNSFNIIEALGEGILDKIEAFRTSKEGKAALEAIKPADLTEEQKKDAKAKDTYTKELTAYYYLFENLYNDILEFTGTKKLLTNNGMLCVFKLDEVIRYELLKICADLSKSLKHPFSQPPVILHDLAVVIYDPAFAAKHQVNLDVITRRARGNAIGARGDEAKTVTEETNDLTGLGVNLNGKTFAAQEEVLRLAGATDAASIIYGIMNLLGNELTDLVQTSVSALPLAQLIHTDVLENTPTLAGRTDTYAALDDAIHALVKKRKDGAGIKAAFDLLANYMTPALNRGLVNFIKSTRLLSYGVNGVPHAKQLLPLDMLARMAGPLQETISAAEKNPRLPYLRDKAKELNDLIKTNEKILREADYKAPKTTFEAPTSTSGGPTTRETYPREAYFKESVAFNPEADNKHSHAIRRDVNVHTNENISLENGIVELNFGVDSSGEVSLTTSSESLHDRLYRETEQAKKALSEVNSELTVMFMPASKALLQMLVSSEKDGNLVTHPDHPLHHLPLPAITITSIWDTLLHNCFSLAIASQYCKLVPNTAVMETRLNELANGSEAITKLCKHMAVIAGVAARDSLKFDAALDKDPKVLAEGLVQVVLDAFKIVKPTSANKQTTNFLFDFVTTYKEKIVQLVSVIMEIMGSSNNPFLTDNLWPAVKKISYPALLMLAIRFMERVNAVDNAPNRVNLASEIIEMLAAFVDPAKRAEHPVITNILTALPENESKIKYAAFLERAEFLFKKIGYTQEDLPLEEWQQESFFSVMKMLGGLSLGLFMDMIFSGKTRERIDGHLFNIGEIEMWKNMLANAKIAREKAEQDKLLGTPRPVTPVVPVRRDTEQERAMNNHVGELIKNLMKLVPDSIARERFFVAPLMKQSSEALGAMWRQKCEDGSYVELIVWMTELLLPNLCKEDKDGNLTFEMGTITPEVKAAAAALAKSLFTDVFSETIINGINTWFESKGQAFEDFIDSVCDAIDRKIDSSVKFAKPIGEAIKTFFRWLATAICWLLFPILWLIKAIIQWRVGVTSDLMHEKRDNPQSRVAGWNVLDIMLGLADLAQASAQMAAAPKRA